MKNMLILGAGTAGTIMANHLRRKLSRREWDITIVDNNPDHYYQPGFLFVPFGGYSEKDLVQPKKKFLAKNINFILKNIDKIEPENNSVILEGDETIAYDCLIIATGTEIVPSEINGMTDDLYKNIFDFYTLKGTFALRDKLKDWQGGKLVIHINEMPIKCPVAPLEFAFLADSWLKKKGVREETELIYVTPLSGAFTKPKASKILGHLLEEKNIKVVPDFSAERVDAENKKLISYDAIEVDYDLMVAIPTNMGDALMERSGLGDDLNFVPTDKHTLQVIGHENIFALGDATNLPASKAGSVAHFQSDVLTVNILRYIKGEKLLPEFDGHANCFVESGNGKALLLDFNYDVEPLPGKFPFPVIGPMSLLKESVFNHWGKLFFKFVYWHILLKAIPLPVSAKMSKMGKIFE